MVKKHVMVTIDDDLHQKAKERDINVSELAEGAIIEKLGKTEIEIDNSIEKCEFCGREDRKATKDDLNGMTWLYPDEKWICKNCLRDYANKTAVGAR